MYDLAIQTYIDYYQYEEIDGSYRKKIELIPEEAFRESIANALIHRAWDLNAKIEFLCLKIELKLYHLVVL